MPWKWAPLVALPLVALDLRVDVYRPLGSDEQNPVYAALRQERPGRLVERPVFLPDRQEQSIYLYYAMQARRERPGGYSTTAPPEADRVARRLERSFDSALLDELGVRYVVRFEGGRPRSYAER